jgi:hypothetical protein
VKPEYLRAGAIILAVLCVLLLVAAVREWSSGRADGESVDAPRPGWWGNALLFLVALGSVGAILTAAQVTGWSRDSAMWVGIGGFLGVLTVLRPWWFWENYRARWLRNAIGDGATTTVYLVLAAIMMWIGLNTDWGFGRR